MKVRAFKYYVCDFETTVYSGQDYTEVWASACVELFHDKVQIFHTIEDQFNYFKGLKQNIICYFHNLKFDGAFWISFLLTTLLYKQAYTNLSEKEYDVKWQSEKDMPNNSFKYSVSDRGQWYNIIVKTGGHIIEFRDSLKLLPFSVRRIGNSFDTKHKKLDMDYEGFRYAGCEITDKEKEYISNDVLVVKEAIEIMFKEGHNKLTIGSCCLEEYKNICEHSTRMMLSYDEMFPNLYEVKIDSSVYKYATAGEYIRRSYRGGWCYLVRGKEDKIYKQGLTADVNSLYPSMMHSESGNIYPIGLPKFWSGNCIPDEAIADNKYYFVRIRTRFYIKENMLPFIQIKNSYLYKSTECLETSDVYDSETQQYYTHYPDKNGNLVSTAVEMTLTMTDYQLLKDHYELVDFEILDGCYFYAISGIFDEYIDKYKKIKQESKGARRELAKLFLNNLYGKMASSTDSSFKVAYVKEDGSIGFVPVRQNDKKPGYIPVGSAITSYARNFTIRAAQKNYYGKDKRGFIYADTDSIHCDLSPEEVKGITIHSKNFCCWKLESVWDNAIFVRQKTYIEHVIKENVRQEGNKWVYDDVEPNYNIKCAGMPQKSKDLFQLSMSGKANIDGYKTEAGTEKQWSEEEKNFLFKDGKPIVRTIKDFRIGLNVPDKLLPKRIKGGIVLVNSSYKMR